MRTISEITAVGILLAAIALGVMLGWISTGCDCVGGDVGMDINVNYAGDKRCQSCGRSFDTYCKYGNAERILRQESYEECPHWIPSPTEKYDQFVSEVERKLHENN